MSRILLSIAAVCVLLFPASGAMAAPAPDSGTAKVQAPQDNGQPRHCGVRHAGRQRQRWRQARNEAEGSVQQFESLQPL